MKRVSGPHAATHRGGIRYIIRLMDDLVGALREDGYDEALKQASLARGNIEKSHDTLPGPDYLIPVCETCESEDLAVLVAARWDKEKHAWVSNDEFEHPVDSPYCLTCERDTTIYWRSFTNDQ